MANIIEEDKTTTISPTTFRKNFLSNDNNIFYCLANGKYYLKDLDEKDTYHEITDTLSDDLKLTLKDTLIRKLFLMYTEEKRITKKLQHIATHDELTDLLNRIQLKKDFARSPNAFLALIDIDQFKEINDSISHSFGDELLKTVALSIKRNLPSRNKVYRYGGEEFVILFKNTPFEEVCESLKQISKDVIIDTEDEIYRVGGESKLERPYRSISIGFIKSNKVFNETMDRADIALYNSKKERGKITYNTKHDDEEYPLDSLNDSWNGFLTSHGNLIMLNPNEAKCLSSKTNADSKIKKLV